MNPNDPDPDSAARETSGAFILGTSLAGWIAGMAVCIAVLTLAEAPTAVTVLFSIGELLSSLSLGAWIAYRLGDDR